MKLHSFTVAPILLVLVTITSASPCLAQEPSQPQEEVIDATKSDAKQTDEPEDKASGFFDTSIEELLDVKTHKPQLYGYVRQNAERVFQIPSVDDNGETQKANDPVEWADVAYHLYGSVYITNQFDVLFNVAGEGSELELRNAWGNYHFSDGLQLRFGKMYRKFGLFNHKLDQSPTFLGIEPPELFDQDHLLLPRTTTFSVHGERLMHDGVFSYSLDTANGEGGAEEDVYPLGWDFRWTGPSMVFGTSGYLSSISSGKTTSTVGVGEGSPRGGVLPWMEGDEYTVYGGFLEFLLGATIVQTAYWRADHEALRDPQSVLTVVREAGISETQRRRFLGENASLDDALLLPEHVVRNADYSVETYYVRVGHSIGSKRGVFTPYLILDWMSHPEAIQSKTYGGDNEAGFADDGEFWKPSLGLVYNPTYKIALKVDASAHRQDFNGKSETYPEFRFDVSFSFNFLE